MGFKVKTSKLGVMPGKGIQMEFETIEEAQKCHAESQAMGMATELDGCKVTILIPTI